MQLTPQNLRDCLVLPRSILSTHADCGLSCGSRVHTTVFLVCLHDISKTNAATIAKLDTELMSLGNPFSLELKGKRSMSQVAICQHGSLHSCECWLLFVLKCENLCSMF